MAGSPARFLIVRLGALGDVVHGLPVAAALRRAHAGARIDWIVSTRHREILDLVVGLDNIIAVRDRRDAGGGISLSTAIARLRRTGYDCAIDLQGLMKSAIIARASGAQRVIGFGRGYVRESLARHCYTETWDPGGAGTFDRAETRHVVTLNLGILSVLGIAPGPPEFPIAAADSPVATDLAARTDGDYVLLNPGAAWPNKRWPPERFAALAQALRARHGLASILLWGGDERPLAERAVAAADGAALLSPRTSVRDLVALARKARLMVSGDTGPTHIAAAVGTPIVGLFGPTRPERNGPWNADDVTVSRADVCECHHLRLCRRETMCLLDIGVEEVLAAVERRLAAAEARRG